MSKSSPNTPHGIVLLVASDVQDKTLREETIPLDDYYDKLHPMIDSDDFRKRGRIRRIHGRIFNYDGNPQFCESVSTENLTLGPMLSS